jgi:transcription antitermination protein NusB
LKAIIPQKRRRSREIALQILYSMEGRENATPDQAIDLFPFESEDEEVGSYASRLIKGVYSRKNEIDAMVRRNVVGWRPERMVIVDRVAIRLALFESLVEKLIPVPVAISEAVELAKRFGTDESGKFVNGVLGKIVRQTDNCGNEKNHQCRE